MYTFQAQHQYEQAASQQPITYPSQGAPASYPQQGGSSLYPSLGDYMGLNLTPEFVEHNMPVVAHVSVTCTCMYMYNLNLNLGK